MSSVLIPEPEGENKSSETVPVTAPLISQDEEDPEAKLYRISFERYKQDECQMDGMHPENAKAALKIIRDIGIYFTSEKNYFAKSGRAEIKPVICGGHYKELCNGLGPDDEVKEIKLDDKKNRISVRLFYFTLEKDKTFYLIAARETHYDTSKGYSSKKKGRFK